MRIYFSFQAYDFPARFPLLGRELPEVTSPSAKRGYLSAQSQISICLCLCVYLVCLAMSTGGKHRTPTHLVAVSPAGPAKGTVEHQDTQEEHVLLWKSAVPGHAGTARRCVGEYSFPAVGRLVGKRVEFKLQFGSGFAGM